MFMNTIAENDQYNLQVNLSKNKAFLIIKGFDGLTKFLIS